MRAADAIVNLLIAHDVDVVFGVPGDTSMSFHNAFELKSDKIEYVSCRDERHAAYMADTYARVSGKVGVVDVPSGGGLLYALPGLSEATSSSIPIICISSDISQMSQGTGALTELKQQELTNTVTKWNVTITQPSRIPHTINKAFRIAKGGRPGAVHISVPENIHETPVQFDEKVDFIVPDKSGFSTRPNKEALNHIVKLLKEAERPAVLAGGGVHLSQAYNELTELMDVHGVPVATSINGKGAVSELSDQAIGVIGVNGGTVETNAIVQRADLVMILGSKLNNVTTVAQTLFENNPKIVQVDISEEIIQLNFNPEVSLVSDIKQFLLELNEDLAENPINRENKYLEWHNFIKETKNKKFDNVEKEVNTDTPLVNPARVIDYLDKLTDDNSLFVIDAGTQNPYMASNYKVKKAGRRTVFDRGHGNLGYALSASIGAKYASSSSKVFSMFGDGSYAMSVGELETAKRMKLPIVFMLFQNNSYGWIKKLHQLYYDEKYIAVDFTEIDGGRIAEGFGLKSKRVTNNDELKEAIEWAINQVEPVFLDIIIEPITDIVPPVTNWRKDSELDPKDRQALTY